MCAYVGGVCMYVLRETYRFESPSPPRYRQCAFAERHVLGEGGRRLFFGPHGGPPRHLEAVNSLEVVVIVGGGGGGASLPSPSPSS